MTHQSAQLGSALPWLDALNPRNRAAAQMLQQLPQLMANHDYLRSVLGSAMTARGQLPGAMQSQLDAFARTVRRFDVLRAMATGYTRQGVRQAINQGRLQPSDIAQFPEGLRGLGVGPLLVIVFAVALAIVSSSTVVAFGLKQALSEWIQKDSTALAEARIIENNLAQVNEQRKEQGLAPIVYTPGTLASATGGIPWWMLAVGGGLALMFILKRKRR